MIGGPHLFERELVEAYKTMRSHLLIVVGGFSFPIVKKKDVAENFQLIGKKELEPRAIQKVFSTCEDARLWMLLGFPGLLTKLPMSRLQNRLTQPILSTIPIQLPYPETSSL